MTYQRHDVDNNPVGLSPYQRHDKDNNEVTSIDNYERHDVDNNDVDISDLIVTVTDVFGNVFRNLDGGYVKRNVDNEIVNVLVALYNDSVLDLNFAETKSLDSSVSFSLAWFFSQLL